MSRFKAVSVFGRVRLGVELGPQIIELDENLGTLVGRTGGVDAKNISKVKYRFRE